MNLVVEIRRSNEDGQGYVLRRRGPDDEIEAIYGSFELDETETRTRTSWQVFVNSLDELDWIIDNEVLEWANGHEWGPVIYVDEEYSVQDEGLLP